MTEISFATSFLTTLSSRPTKVSLDHYEDPKTYPARSAYILPKALKPFQKRSSPSPNTVGTGTVTSTSSGSSETIQVTLKSARNPLLTITLEDQHVKTSIHQLKEQVSSQANIPISALRLLYGKKPVGDSKILKDLVGGAGNGEGEGLRALEFGIMVIGGATMVGSTAAAASPTPALVPSDSPTPVDVQSGDPMIVDAPVAQGQSGKEVVDTDEFWADLRGFLLQRIRDEPEGEKLFATFRQAHEGRS